MMSGPDHQEWRSPLSRHPGWIHQCTQFAHMQYIFIYMYFFSFDCNRSSHPDSGMGPRGRLFVLFAFLVVATASAADTKVCGDIRAKICYFE